MSELLYLVKSILERMEVVIAAGGGSYTVVMTMRPLFTT